MKLLICDDDISTIDVIRKNIDFSVLGIDKILEAYNGNMAKELIHDEDPELILCDIGMPKVDGIEVLKYSRNYNDDAEFSFLTCHEDFEYAHISIEYGVAGYVVKPFKLKQVEETLQKMIDNYKNKHDNSETQIKKDLVSSTVFSQIIDGLHGTNKDSIQEYLDNNDVVFKADSSWKIVFSCLNIVDIGSEWSKGLLLFMASRVHDEILNNYVGCAHTVVKSDDRFLWCITFVKGDIDKDELENRCRTLCDFCDEHFSIKPVMLVSDQLKLYDSFEVVKELYETMRKIRFYGGKIFYQSDSLLDKEDSAIINEYQLLWYLKNRDVSGFEEYISEIIIAVDKTKDYDRFKKEITLFFITVYKDNNIPNNLLYENDIINEINKETPNKTNSLAYSIELMNIYQKAMNEINDAENIVLKAKQFVDDNFHDDIGRDDIAEVVFVTPNYLSKLFRKNMGMNLREYINQLRVDEAKRLLLSTNMSISEIAIYVGYYNISYFSTIFHKLVGVSPAEWRENGD